MFCRHVWLHWTRYVTSGSKKAKRRIDDVEDSFVFQWSNLVEEDRIRYAISHSERITSSVNPRDKLFPFSSKRNGIRHFISGLNEGSSRIDAQREVKSLCLTPTDYFRELMLKRMICLLPTFSSSLKTFVWMSYQWRIENLEVHEHLI